MERRMLSPRSEWQRRVESQGLTFHTHDDGQPYWREDACYAFRLKEIEGLESAAAELQRLCILAVETAIQRRLYARFGLPEALAPLVEESWERDEVAIYGRFDFAYDGQGLPKLLEYNADTPTSLVEASVIQWHWLQDRFPELDQWNSLHERLVEAWRRARTVLPLGTLYFLHQDTNEDQQTVAYLRDCADQAGHDTAQMRIEDLGWNPEKGAFVDVDDRPVRSAFKLYPWEFLIQDAYGELLLQQPRPITFLEPAWKMFLSNKALLALLWELFPTCPYLLPAYLDGPRNLTTFVKKPLLSREGANVEVHRPGQPVMAAEVNPAYGAEGQVWQGLASLPNMDGFHPVLGAWVVDGAPAGMGIRESRHPITDNGSAFVPHLIEG